MKKSEKIFAIFLIEGTSVIYQNNGLFSAHLHTKFYPNRFDSFFVILKKPHFWGQKRHFFKSPPKIFRSVKNFEIFSKSSIFVRVIYDIKTFGIFCISNRFLVIKDLFWKMPFFAIFRSNFDFEILNKYFLTPQDPQNWSKPYSGVFKKVIEWLKDSPNGFLMIKKKSRGGQIDPPPQAD